MANNNDDSGGSKKEFVTLGPSLPDGSVMAVKSSDDGIQFGTLHKINEGDSLLGKDLVRLSPVDNLPLYEMEHIYDGSIPDQKNSGPSMVNSRAYRDGWDNIFGNKKSSVPTVN
jgi:hypothetical protein